MELAESRARWWAFSGAVHALLGGALACSPDFRAPSITKGAEITETHGQQLDAVGLAPRFSIRADEAGGWFESLMLVEGEISAASRKRLRRGEVPVQVAEREIPSSVWLEGGELFLAPAEPLQAAEVYTLAALGGGVLGEFFVDPEPESVKRVMWPRRTAVDGTLVVCAVESVGPAWPLDAAEPLDHALPLGAGPTSDDESSESATRSSSSAPVSVILAPGNVPARWVPSLGEPSAELAGCSFIELGADSAEVSFVLPPASLDDVAVVASPLPVVGTTAADTREGCRSLRSCATFAGAVATVAEAASGLWLLTLRDSDERTLLSRAWLLESSSTLRFGALPEVEDGTLSAAHLDAHGRLTTSSIAVSTRATSPHVVINEVYANPVGAEPRGEWIELVNVGTAGADLEGWTLDDVGGTTVLPRVTLDAGQVGVIVNADYLPDPDLDLPPIAGTVAIVVKRLGQGGLNNGGELLRLRDRSGTVVSSVPAIAADAGVSVVRVHPWAPDAPESFVSHPEPGASPGEVAP